jgi:hypothetical protein
MTETIESLLQAILAALQDLRDPEVGESMPLAKVSKLVEALRGAIAAYERPLGPLGVVLEGGMLSAVITDDERLRGTEVRVIDYDVEGAADDELILVPQLPGDEGERSKAVVSACSVVSPEINFAETCRRFDRLVQSVDRQ